MFSIKEKVAIVEQEGIILSREFILANNDATFSLQVGIPEYIEKLRTSRERTQIDFENNEVFVMAGVDLADEEKVLEALNSAPEDLLSPFLVLQEK